VDWCPTHAEFIVTGGSDRQFKLWSLRVEPHHLLASYTTDSVVQLGRERKRERERKKEKY